MKFLQKIWYLGFPILFSCTHSANLRVTMKRNYNMDEKFYFKIKNQSENNKVFDVGLEIYNDNRWISILSDATRKGSRGESRVYYLQPDSAYINDLKISDIFSSQLVNNSDISIFLFRLNIRYGNSRQEIGNSQIFSSTFSIRK